jgi:hypothetical protein
MIHPLTLVTFLAFFGAGFYVFQTKEDVAQLDRELRDIRRQTELERGRTQVLAAEWARLNDQDRLRQMAGIHLRNMQPMEPAQFQRLEDAQRRMPVAVAFAAVPTGFRSRSDAPSAPGEVLVFNAATLARDAAPAPRPVVLAVAPAASALPAPMQPAPVAIAPAAVASAPAAIAPVALAPEPIRPVAARAAMDAMPPRPVAARPAVAPPSAAPIRLADTTPRPLPRPRVEMPAADASPRLAAAPQPAIRTAMANPTLVSAPATQQAPCSAALPPPCRRPSPSAGERRAEPGRAAIAAFGAARRPESHGAFEASPSRALVRVNAAEVRHRARTRGRLVVAACGFAVLFAAVAIKLTDATVLDPAASRIATASRRAAPEPPVSRAEITDRNGEVLAVSVRGTALYARPPQIDNPIQVADRWCASCRIWTASG